MRNLKIYIYIYCNLKKKNYDKINKLKNKIIINNNINL